jgi:hypothetical protein
MFAIRRSLGSSLVLAAALSVAPAVVRGQTRPDGDSTTRITGIGRIAPPDSLAAARAFVQRFYDDYLSRSAKSWSAYRRMLDTSPPVFTAALAGMLKADLAALRDSVQSPDVLNFEPFLTMQDTPCGPFKVQDVRRRGSAFLVSVKEVCPNSAGSTVPTLWPAMEIVSDAGRWVISNMFYSDTRSLTGLLCLYAKADTRPERRPTKCP